MSQLGDWCYVCRDKEGNRILPVEQCILCSNTWPAQPKRDVLEPLFPGHERAACLGHADRFIPNHCHRCQNGHHTEVCVARVDHAKTICQHCECLDACYEWAVNVSRPLDGVVAGMTTRERLLVVTKRRLEAS